MGLPLQKIKPTRRKIIPSDLSGSSLQTQCRKGDVSKPGESPKLRPMPGYNNSPFLYSALELLYNNIFVNQHAFLIYSFSEDRWHSEGSQSTVNWSARKLFITGKYSSL